MIVENGGFGSSAASPIVRKIMDTYLLDANGQLKVPLPEGAKALTPGNGMAPLQGRRPRARTTMTTSRRRTEG